LAIIAVAVLLALGLAWDKLYRRDQRRERYVAKVVEPSPAVVEPRLSRPTEAELAELGRLRREMLHALALLPGTPFRRFSSEQATQRFNHFDSSLRAKYGQDYRRGLEWH